MALWELGAEEAASFLVTFREAFEAFLLAGIVAGVIVKAGRRALLPYVAIGFIVATIGGLGLGALIYVAYRGFPEEELFEAGASIMASAVLLSVVYWMQRHAKQLVASAKEEAARAATPLAVAGLTAFLVGRESLETVLILAPMIAGDPLGSLLGASAGTILAGGLAGAILMAGLRLNLKMFFRTTSALLILIASGLAGYGVHEALEWLEEEGRDPGLLAAKVYDLEVGPDSPLSTDHPVGAVLGVLIGWTPEMELARLIAQSLVLAIGAYILLSRR